MIIFNKNKHFDKIIVDLYNMSMANIRKLNILLTPCGAKRLIEKNKEKFVIVTFFYLLFFQECALQKKYCPRYKCEVVAVLDALINQIANQFNYDYSKLTCIYYDVRQMLDDLSNNPNIEKVGLYYGVAVHYLQYAFSGEYNIEESIYEDDTPYVKVGEFFQQSLTAVIEHLDS